MPRPEKVGPAAAGTALLNVRVLEGRGLTEPRTVVIDGGVISRNTDGSTVMNALTPLVNVHAHFLTPRDVQEAAAAGHLRPDGTSTPPSPNWPTPWTSSEATASRSRPTPTASNLGDPRFEPLLAELDRRHTPVFAHPAHLPAHQESVSMDRPRPMLEFIFDSTRTVSDLVFNRRLQQYPNIPWIFTHDGGTLPLLTERMEFFLVSSPLATTSHRTTRPSTRSPNR